MILDHFYCIRFVAVASGLKKFFEEGDPLTYFCPSPWIQPFEDMAETS